MQLLLNAADIDAAQAIAFCGLPLLVHPLLQSLFSGDSLEEALQQVQGRIGQVSPARLLQELEDKEPSILLRTKELSEGKLAQEVLQLDGWRGQVAARLLLIEKQLALEMLGLAQSADSTSITKAFKRRAVELHPDKGGDQEEFQLLQQMKDVLLGSKASAEKQDDETGVSASPRKRSSEAFGDSQDTDDEIDNLLRNRGAADEATPAQSRTSRKAGLQASRVKLHQAVSHAWSRCGRLCSQLSRYKQAGQGPHADLLLAPLETFLAKFEQEGEEPRCAPDGSRLGLLVSRGAEFLGAAALLDPEATLAVLTKSGHMSEIQEHEGWPRLIESMRRLPSQVESFLASTQQLGLEGAPVAKPAKEAEPGTSMLVPRESALQEVEAAAAATAVQCEGAPKLATCDGQPHKPGCVCTKCLRRRWGFQKVEPPGRGYRGF
ncbi:dnaJ [Symbiodinium natans]|uniref:DnaJ protein n=1 Tax=Symbiodinium natans TaxID=878477 RepID=A0A812U2Z9_9DINO|nr:dnaJ [Symbiodinium natans]